MNFVLFGGPQPVLGHAQGSFLAGFREPYVVPEIEPRSAALSKVSSPENSSDGASSRFLSSYGYNPLSQKDSPASSPEKKKIHSQAKESSSDFRCILESPGELVKLTNVQVSPPKGIQIQQV